MRCKITGVQVDGGMGELIQAYQKEIVKLRKPSSSYEFEESFEISGSNSEDFEDFKYALEGLCHQYGYEINI